MSTNTLDRQSNQIAQHMTENSVISVILTDVTVQIRLMVTVSCMDCLGSQGIIALLTASLLQLRVTQCNPRMVLISVTKTMF